MDKPQIAFLGLGIMGTGMSRRLLTHGFSVKVWNRNPAKAQALAADGAVACATPREAVGRRRLSLRCSRTMPRRAMYGSEKPAHWRV